MTALRWAIAGAAVGGAVSVLGALAILAWAKSQREWAEITGVVG